MQICIAFQITGAREYNWGSLYFPWQISSLANSEKRKLQAWKSNDPFNGDVRFPYDLVAQPWEIQRRMGLCGKQRDYTLRFILLYPDPPHTSLQRYLVIRLQRLSLQHLLQREPKWDRGPKILLQPYHFQDLEVTSSIPHCVLVPRSFCIRCLLILRMERYHRLIPILAKILFYL